MHKKKSGSNEHVRNPISRSNSCTEEQFPLECKSTGSPFEQCIMDGYGHMPHKLMSFSLYAPPY